MYLLIVSYVLPLSARGIRLHSSQYKRVLSDGHEVGQGRPTEAKSIQELLPHVPLDEILAMELTPDQGRLAFYAAMLLSKDDEKSINTLLSKEKEIKTKMAELKPKEQKVLQQYLTAIQNLRRYLQKDKSLGKVESELCGQSTGWMNEVWQARVSKDSQDFVKALAFKDKKSLLIAQTIVGEDKGAASAFGLMPVNYNKRLYLTLDPNTPNYEYFKSKGIISKGPFSIDTPGPAQKLPDFMTGPDWNMDIIKKIVGENPTAIHDWIESSKEKFEQNNAEEAEGSDGQKKALSLMRQYSVVSGYDAEKKTHLPNKWRSTFQTESVGGFELLQEIKDVESAEVQKYVTLIKQGKHEEAFDWMQSHLKEWRAIVDFVDLTLNPEKELAIPKPKKGTLQYLEWEAAIGQYSKPAVPKVPSSLSKILDSVMEIHEGLYLLGVAGQGHGKALEIKDGLSKNIQKVGMILKDSLELKANQNQKEELEKALLDIVGHLNDINWVSNSSELNQKIYQEKLLKPIQAILDAQFDIIDKAAPVLLKILNDPPTQKFKNEALSQIESSSLPTKVKDKLLSELRKIEVKK